MDLDTNVKGLSKFKYSTLYKFICVALCLITFLCSVGITAFGLSAVQLRLDNSINTKEKVPTVWTETEVFQYLLSQQAEFAVNEITTPRREKAKLDELESKKKAILDKAEKQCKEISDTYYYDEDYGEYHYTEGTFVQIPVTVKADNDNIHYFEFDVEELPSDSKKRAERLDYEYEEFIENCCISDTYYEALSEELNIYSKTKDKEYPYLIDDKEKFDEKNAVKSDHYIIVENGKLKSFEGVPEEIANHIFNWHFRDNSYAQDIYMCIYFNDADLTAPDFIHSFESKNSFAGLKQMFDDTQSIYDKIVLWGIVDVLCLIASFVFGFMYFSKTGRKNEEESGRIYFWDYLFVEPQLVITGLLCYGAVVLAVISAENVSNYFLSQALCVIWSLFAIACWILLFGLCSSIARYLHSDKKFYKHFLTYWILFALFHLFKYIFKGIARLVKKTHSANKKLLSLLKYKPKKFKRNVIILSILYFTLNLISDFIIIIGIYYEVPISLLLLLATIVSNVLVIRRVLIYIKNLDIIISASEAHEDSGLITELLDPSLQILNESMRYTNAELQQAINKAVRDERLRTELITNVSHDLKTPLTSIINYVDLLSKCDIGDDTAKEYLAVLDEKSSKLKRLIEDLIEASKLSSGNITVNLTPLNLTELCLQSTVDVQRDFDESGLELIVKQGERPITVFGDGSKTYRVLENLFSNAKKYSARASRVYVSAYEESGYGVIEIKNISAKPLDISAEELTERFVRGDESRTQEGNGLGLSIAKELCKAQKGELELIIDGDLFKAKVKIPLR